MVHFLQQPWPWYIAGPLIGLTVPALLIAGNKTLGISASLRQICAACVPFNNDFLKYDWKKEQWNLYFVGGILIGGFLAGYVFANPAPVAISSQAAASLQQLGIQQQKGLLPQEIFNWQNLFTMRGLLIIVIGGFLVGFGTRYAGGCTSGHGIMGLAALQWPSLVAVISFFAGGIITSWFILPLLLKL